MNNLIEVITEFEYKSRTLKYSQRLLTCFKAGIHFYLFLFLGIGIMSSFTNAILITSFFLFLNFIEFRSWSKYYITYIKRSEDQLQINYYIKDTMNVIKADIDSFSFEEKRVWYKIRGRTPFLLVHHENKVLLKQFLFLDINEVMISKIIYISRSKT